MLVSIDTLRADRLPAYGYAKVETPNLDAFAREAVVFDRAFAHSPQTLPSHASMLSGKLPFEHGVRDNLGFRLREGERLLPAMMRERGFTSLGVVSAYVLRTETGIGQGFDTFDAKLPPASPESSIGQVQRDGRASLAVAERWLAARSDPRFFLFFHIYEPHKPYAPPERHARFAPYDGEVAYSDEIVGGLLNALRARDLYDAATIVVTSDHGEGLGDHHELEHGLFLYNETTRVPLLVKLPRGAHGGRRVGATVQHIDLVPTILDAVDAPIPEGLRGRSLRPLLEDRTSSLAGAGVYAEALYSRYHFGWSELVSLTDDRFRYIKAPTDELYDLDTDFGERRNIANDRPQTRTAMRQALDRLSAGARIDEPSASVSEVDREALQALGYVSSGRAVPADAPGEGLPDPKDKVDVLEKYRAAVDLVGKRQYAEAIPLFRNILAGDPAMADVWLQLAHVLARTGRYDEAADAYKQAIRLKPGEPSAVMGAAAMLLRLRRMDEAEAHARLALSTAPTSAHEMLAKIALARADYAVAEREAVLASESDPTVALPLFIRGLMFYRQQRYPEALACFEDAIAKSRERTLQINELHYYTGDTLARLGRYQEAESELRQEIQLFPHSTSARASLAMVYAATGRDDAVVRVIEAMLEVSPSPNTYALAARLWRIFGLEARARAVEQAASTRFGRAWQRAVTDDPAPAVSR